MRGFINTFTIFSGEMRYIWIGSLYFIIHTPLGHWWNECHISVHWDGERVANLKRWQDLYRRIRSWKES